MWPRSRIGQAVVLATVAYRCLWALYLFFPGFKIALLATPYLGGGIELFTGLYVALVITWAAFQLIFRS